MSDNPKECHCWHGMGFMIERSAYQKLVDTNQELVKERDEALAAKDYHMELSRQLGARVKELEAALDHASTDMVIAEQARDEAWTTLEATRQEREIYFKDLMFERARVKELEAERADADSCRNHNLNLRMEIGDERARSAKIFKALQELVSQHMRLHDGDSVVFGPLIKMAKEALQEYKGDGK